jgi:hypothetical protein
LDENISFIRSGIEEYSTLHLLPKKNNCTSLFSCDGNGIDEMEITFVEVKGKEIAVKVNKTQTIGSIRQLVKETGNKVLLFGSIFLFLLWNILIYINRCNFKR